MEELREDGDELWWKAHSTLGCGSPSDYYTDYYTEEDLDEPEEGE